MPTSETSNHPRYRFPTVLDWMALVLMIIGSLNWGLIGVMQFDLVAAIFGVMTPAARIVYAAVGLAGVYGLVIAFMWSRDSASS